MKTYLLPALVLTTGLMALAFNTEPAKAQNDIDLRLYRLDCGTIQATDLNLFSLADDYTGQQKHLVDSCYLIKHDENWMLWDTGLNEQAVNAQKERNTFVLNVSKSLLSQLSELNLTPADIDYVGLSHTHFDHVGNVNMFPDATLILQKAEHDVLTNPELAQKLYIIPDFLSHFITGEGKDNVRLLDGDTDLFGDGTLKAIFLPGHTPGHMALQVNLKESGPVILSGDQWHFEENKEKDNVPDFNYSEAETKKSSARLKQLVKDQNARLVLQHGEKDNESLPAFPAYLE